ncbi:ribosome maturation factor RimP [Gemmiger formicilis]|uniref:ribosome maturation factor RimP n=1 Tax=Gemmiger formicilis TaxID=745368 RepID=UPI0039917F7F
MEALVRPTVEGFGLRLWDVRFEKEGPDWFLRVLIDRDEPLDTPARRFPVPSTRFWTRLTPLTRATTLKSAAPAWAAA